MGNANAVIARRRRYSVTFCQWCVSTSNSTAMSMIRERSERDYFACAHVCVCVSVAVFGNFLHTVCYLRYSIFATFIGFPCTISQKARNVFAGHNKIELKPRKTHNGYLRRHSLFFYYCPNASLYLQGTARFARGLLCKYTYKLVVQSQHELNRNLNVA